MGKALLKFTELYKNPELSLFFSYENNKTKQNQN